MASSVTQARARANQILPRRDQRRGAGSLNILKIFENSHDKQVSRVLLNDQCLDSHRRGRCQAAQNDTTNPCLDRREAEQIRRSASMSPAARRSIERVIGFS
jgi:hypothetical protein